MSSLTVSKASAKPYVSRRKRHRRRQAPKLKDLLSTRSVLGLLGLLLLTLLVSLGIIVFQASQEFRPADSTATASAN
ncbi:hypothetical protein EJV47_18725 [Hymenobacter gummosus]|uniref:Uncharacterized protein n=1 Tax=Hymenobacter gummosus TaxID=1776032 RepID=A0A431TYN3_9BACT|nr:hypothetical protein [Hymenobacter gummosus]RTQ47460.1 hypothetical protein EJV47_18725 [Hymenobacter gummosus]